jgi:hypothetical protein
MTLTANLVPVILAAAAGTVMSVVPSNNTPLIVLAVCNLVVEKAFPDSVAPTNSLASTLINLLVPDVAVTFPLTLPIRSAVMVPASKSPALSLATILPIILDELASTAHVVATEPLKLAPVR